MRDVLSSHPQGLSEHALLNQLRDHLGLFQGDRSDPLTLFRQHFILFHALYRLQQTLLAAGEGHLDINPLNIRLHPGPVSGHRQQLSQPDPVRTYYLTLDHLKLTGRADVEALFNTFWTMLGRSDQRDAALQVLGLSDPVDNTAIRRRYQKLVMQHHPDRGGDTQRLQLLNAAIDTLLPAKS